jgi:methylmalonyl-CoA/ethylmalonyl-CoA epimerase
MFYISARGNYTQFNGVYLIFVHMKKSIYEEMIRMIVGIKHIGVAVKSIDDTMALWSKIYGAKELKRDAFEIAGQTSALVQIGDTYLELMEPLPGFEDRSTVYKYLQTHGEGLHHLSFKTDDLAGDIKTMEEAGVKILGAGGPIVFTHPKTTTGIVNEITEMDD